MTGGEALNLDLITTPVLGASHGGSPKDNRIKEISSAEILDTNLIKDNL
jgi:hypothetical protein